MNFGTAHALTVIALAGTPTLPVMALDSDKNQPATLEADDFELDLETGVRTYRGGVVFRQGSIHLDCDELVTYYNEDDKLDKGVCTGNPGKFRQRPEGRDSDALGRARSITLDRVKGVVVLENRADIEQGGKQIHGQLITYDLQTKKVKVAGRRAAADLASAAPTGTGGGQPAGETETNDVAAGRRPGLIIQPRNNRQN